MRAVHYHCGHQEKPANTNKGEMVRAQNTQMRLDDLEETRTELRVKRRKLEARLVKIKSQQDRVDDDILKACGVL